MSYSAQIKNADDFEVQISIGSMATNLKIHPRTLRIYDKEQILSPKRTSKNRRYYTLVDVKKAQLILFLTRNLALNLAGVKIILKLLSIINPENQLEYVERIAKTANIDLFVQKKNIAKNLKKGRKRKEGYLPID